LFQHLVYSLTTLSVGAVMATVFVLSVLETSLVVGLVLPGEVLVAACVGLLHLYWVPLAGVAAAAGCLTGQFIGYFLGLKLGPTLRDGWVGRRTGPDRWAQAERLVQAAGFWLLITARFVAVVHTLAPVLAGALRMPIRRFALSAALSSALWAMVWVTIGAVVGQTGRMLDHGLIITGMVIVGVVVATVVSSRLLRAPTRSRESTLSREGSGPARDDQ
jgi:membrane-associated protein